MTNPLPDDAASHPAPPSVDVDQELVVKVQSGDAPAFDQLVEKYKTRIYGLLYNMLGNHEDAADLSQEVFVRAFKSIHGFQKKANFYTWLYRIAVNTALNFLKSRKTPDFSLNEWNPEIEEESTFKELTSHETGRQAL